MEIQIWSDVVCPFCYLGKRELEQALAGFEHRDEVTITWRSFELDPTIEAVSDATLVEKIAAKYQMSLEQAEQSQRQIAERAAGLGLEFNWREARFGNTFDAHRLVHLARELGREHETYERLLQAYFTEGVAVGDHTELARLAAELGLPGERVEALLTSDEYAAAVRADEAAAREIGVTGVPFFVLADRYAVSGAQPREVFEQALARAWQDTHRQGFVDVGEAGEACGPDGC